MFVRARRERRCPESNFIGGLELDVWKLSAEMTDRLPLDLTTVGQWCRDKMLQDGIGR